MTSLPFPDTGTRMAVYRSGIPAASQIGELFTDAACTTPAEVYVDNNGTKGALIADSKIALDQYGQQNNYWGPADGTDTLWIRINGVVARVDADYNSRIDSLDGRYQPGIYIATAPQYGYTSGAEIAAACQAAINAMPASVGGTLWIPPGNWTFANPVVARAGVQVRGAGSGAATAITATGGAFTWATTLSNFAVEDLKITCSGGHIFATANGSGIYLSRFRNLNLVQNSTGFGILSHDSNTDYDKVLVENCDMFRSGSATVPGWYVRNSGGAANENVWRNLRVNSANCTSTPFFWLESNSTSANYAYDNRFEDILGESCAGGVVHAFSTRNLHLSNIVDWDTSVTYTGDIVKVGKSTAIGSTRARNMFISGCGRRGGNAGSTYDINLVPGEIASATVVEFHNSGLSGKMNFGAGDSVNILNAPGGTGWTGQPSGATSYFGNGVVFEQGIYFGTARETSGTGSPEGVVTGNVGDTYRRTNGTPGAVFYVKESGTGNTGWVAK